MANEELIAAMGRVSHTFDMPGATETGQTIAETKCERCEGEGLVFNLLQGKQFTCASCRATGYRYWWLWGKCSGIHSQWASCLEAGCGGYHPNVTLEGLLWCLPVGWSLTREADVWTVTDPGGWVKGANTDPLEALASALEQAIGVA